MTRFLPVVTTIFFLFVGTAHAYEFNDADAQKLKTSLQTFLDFEKSINELSGGIVIDYKGELVVAPQADSYAITLPNIVIKGSDPGATNDLALDLGVVNIIAIPEDQEGLWKMAVTIPSHYNFSDKTGEVMSLSIGSQQFFGVYSEKLGYFTKSKGDLNDLTFKVGGEDSGIKIGNLKLQSLLSEDENGLYSGPGEFSLNNVSFKDKDNKVNFTLGSFITNFDIERIDLPDLATYKNNLEKHAATLKSLQNIEQKPEAVDSAKIQDIIAMISDLYGFKLGGFSLKYSLKDLTVTDNSGPSEQGNDVKNLNLDNVFFALGLHDMDKEEGQFNLSLGFDGIKAEPMDAEYDALSPKSVNIELDSAKIPVKTLSDLTAGYIKTITENPEMADMAAMGTLFKIPMLLAQAGTTINIKNTYMNGKDYSTNINGQIVADMNAVTNVNGKVDGLFAGLDKLIETVNGFIQAPDSKHKAELQNTLSTLEMFKSLGKPTTDASGGPAYAYEMLITPQGQMTLNGQDMSTLNFGGGAAANDNMAEPEPMPGLDGTPAQ